MKLSKLMKEQSPRQGFPMVGRAGYAGEQDGTHVMLTHVMCFASKQQADAEYPNGVPEYMKLHWGVYTPGEGWAIVLGCWSDQLTDDAWNTLAFL